MKTPGKFDWRLRLRVCPALGIAMCLALASVGSRGTILMAQATAPAASQSGTVKAIAGSTLTIATDAGQQFTVDAASASQILQLEPGSKDLKSAQHIELGGIAVGDRVLVTGKAGDAPSTITASRLILMKAADLAQQHAAEQADWQKNGSGGIVSAVDPATGTVTVTSGARKIQVQTSSSTVYRRYASDSVKFEDAKLGALADLHAGDQMRVRGTKSADGLSIQAKEIVSGTFKDIAGLLSAVDPAAGTVTLKDLTTKKTVTVKVTANSDLRALPPEISTMFVQRTRGGQGGAGGGQAGRQGGGQTGGQPAAGQPGSPQAGGQRGPGGPGGGARNMDLSQMMSRFPATSLSALKKGDAVMIVATQPGQSDSSGNLTAVTMLSGVEAILTAAPTATLGPVGGGGGGGEGGMGGGDMGGGMGGGGGMP